MTTPPGLTPDFLRWEHEIVAGSEPIWMAHVQPLIRAADSLWERGAKAREVEQSIQETDEKYPLTASLSYEGETLETLRDVGLSRVAILLLGYAIEGIAKVLLMRTTPGSAVQDGRFRHAGHDLVTLLERAEMDLSEEESARLTVVRDYIEWFGKYPVPLEAAGRSGPRSAPGAWVARRLGDETDTWRVARAVLDRTIEKQRAIFFAPGAT